MHSAPRRPTPEALRLRLLRLAGGGLAPLAARPRRDVRRVLLLRPDHVGDVLLSAPAVALLRASLPRARITYLVGPWSLEAARHGPRVDEVRALAFPGFTRRKKANPLAPYATLARCAADLRAETYDVAVVLRGDHWWGALLAVAAGIPIRAGADTPETRPLLTHVHRATGEAWAAQALGVARAALGALGSTPATLGPVEQFTIGEAAREEASALLRAHALPPTGLIGIHPSAGAPLKSWPVERWARLADAFIGRGFAVLFTGAPEDDRLLAAIAGHMQRCAPRLCGQSLEVSAALYARCALVVTVDSGAGHLAAAVGTPTIRLYGPASASIFGPWPPSASQRVLTSDALACAPCGCLESPPCGARSTPACMLALDVEDVLKAVGAQLDRR